MTASAHEKDLMRRILAARPLSPGRELMLIELVSLMNGRLEMLERCERERVGQRLAER